MRVATWNVNSIRTRAARVVDWLVREDIDVLGMQEIKCKPEEFPTDIFEDAGYDIGQKAPTSHSKRARSA
jgi:exodeoxyribonuclease-3